MKKMLIVAALLSAASLKAAEYPDNPDRFPSIGLTLAGASESGDAKIVASPVSATQDIESSSGLFTLDLRLPVSNNITLSGSVSSVSTGFTAKETMLLTGQESDSDGYAFSVGVRFYIH